MSPQLTLQTPLKLPPEEIPSYLEQLWSKGQSESAGSNTFCLVVWQPAWIEQHLVRTGRIPGPIIGTHNQEVIDAAQKIVLEGKLPHSTSAFDNSVSKLLAQQKGNEQAEDLRGEHIDSAISALQPRRLITLAPTISKDNKLETLVAAYCPIPEESGAQSACGDVVVLRGNLSSLRNGLNILPSLLPKDLPSWIWWNGHLDEAKDLLSQLSEQSKRLIIDTSLGLPSQCLGLLQQRVESAQPVNDLNWLRLRSWRETLAMVFDPPSRRNYLNEVIKLDIDIEGEHPVQGLLLAAWIADRLGWQLLTSEILEGEIIEAKFQRKDNKTIQCRICPLPVGRPIIHPGQIVGIRLICKPSEDSKKALCIILGSETGECMRLEAGGMASMELLEEVVPIKITPVEMDIARLLSSSRDSTSPLLATSAPLAAKILNKAHSDS